MWVASGYGSATGTVIARNRIISSADAVKDFPAVRMGWTERTDCLAKDIEFRSNVFEGIDFTIDASPQHHSYSVYWTLTIHVIDRKEKAVKGTQVSILDREGKEIWGGITDDNGSVEAELEEYRVDGDEITRLSPFTVIVRKKKEEIYLDANQTITIEVR
ncbi:MAG: hypothetical protein AMS26_17770 [Bacteroides sp. SM23_62]|nr:MAG: hypothetical protein AMS26_17770 [Bacteroides sp. SM23_62]